MKLTNTILCFAALLIAPMHAASNPIEIVRENDETHRVITASSPNHQTTSCAGMSANIVAKQSEGEALNIMATIGVHSDSGSKTFDLFDVAKDSLTPEHSNVGMLVGCLTESGGIGIYVPHKDGFEQALNIQIDKQGHIFLGYDKIGMMLRVLKPD